MSQVGELLQQFSFPVAAARIEIGVSRAEEYGDSAAVYPWMSVTKLATARTILAAVEHGVVELDTDITGELTLNSGVCFNFDNTRITLRHLLSHCSGLAFSKPEQVSAPQTRRIYSNIGYELAAAVLERESGVDFEIWMQQMLFTPLEMAAKLEGSPAYGIQGSLRDLELFARELLIGQYLSESMQNLYFEPSFPGLSGVLPGYGMQKNNLWGLGPEIRANKSPHWTSSSANPEISGHFGQSGSFLWVDRASGIAGVFLGAQPFGEEHKRLWPELNQRWGA